MGLLTTSLIGAGTSLLSGLFGSKAANKAAEEQARAARYSADLEAQAAKDALLFQGETRAQQQANYEEQQRNQAPFLQASQGAITTLSGLVNNGGFPDWQGRFVAPTGEEVRNTPGYEFMRREGERALENSASARGTVLSGGHLKALDRYGTDYADTKYGEAYGRSVSEYERAYNEFINKQDRTFNRFGVLAGIGQTASNQLGSNAANFNSTLGAGANLNTNTLLSSARGIGDRQESAAAMNASGYVGGANAWTGALSQIGGNAQTISLLKLLERQRNAGTYGVPGGIPGPPRP